MIITLTGANFSANNIGKVNGEVYNSYVGSAVFCNTGLRISKTGESSPWVEEVNGTTASSTNLIEVKSTDSVWIQYVFNKSGLHSAGAFYDENQSLITALDYVDFGVELNPSSSGAGAFATIQPTNRVAIADVESETGKKVKYVRFTSWSNSTGGIANTEARIYH